MAHLNDKLADFFYEELPATEMVEARRHVADCGECRAQVQLFERTHLALKTLPDAEPPRSVILARPERRTAWGVLDWRFLAPMAAAVAALVIAIIPASSPAPAPAPVALTAPVPAPVVVPAATAAIDYDRIVDQVRQSERAWFTDQLAKRDREIRQLEGQLAYYEGYQRTVMKETWQNASSIQLLAQRTASQD
jgi:anti-sigma factor RsiW